MNKFMAIFYDSFLEIKDRKIFYLYWLVAIVLVLFFGLLPGSLKFNGQSIMDSGLIEKDMVQMVVANFFSGFFGFMIFLMLFGSAGLMPSFLSKGRVELVLSKPISRPLLLINKFISVYIVMCLVLAVASGIIWLTISFKAHIFATEFFSGLLLSFVDFFIVYSIIFTAGLVANSGAVAIMVYFIIWFAGKLLVGRELLYSFLGDSIWKTILDACYHILPKFSELSANYYSLMTGQGFGDMYPIWSSLLFAVAVLLAGMFIFLKKDY